MTISLYLQLLTLGLAIVSVSTSSSLISRISVFLMERTNGSFFGSKSVCSVNWHDCPEIDLHFHSQKDNDYGHSKIMLHLILLFHCTLSVGLVWNKVKGGGWGWYSGKTRYTLFFFNLKIFSERVFVPISAKYKQMFCLAHFCWLREILLSLHLAVKVSQ